MIKVECVLWEKLDEKGNSDQVVTIHHDFSCEELTFFLENVKEHGLRHEDFIYKLEETYLTPIFEITNELDEPKLYFVLDFIEFEAA